MSLAIAEAKIAKDQGELPFGSAITCGETVVGQGGARDHTSGDVTDHAEIIALRSACRQLGRNNLQDCTIYCTNEPCNMCAAAIFQAKIPHIIIAISRADLPNLLRPRQIDLNRLAADSGYETHIIRDFMKKEALELFADVQKPS